MLVKCCAHMSYEYVLGWGGRGGGRGNSNRELKQGIQGVQKIVLYLQTSQNDSFETRYVYVTERFEGDLEK